VIVKFRDGASTTARIRSLSLVSATTAVSEDHHTRIFDLVRIDPSDDAEAVADVFGASRRRVRAGGVPRSPLMVPNDQLYAIQWNLPMIDLGTRMGYSGGRCFIGERLPCSTPGVAFQSAVVRFNGRAFRDDLGNLHPALGPVDIPFAAATDLFSSSRFVQPHDFIGDDNCRWTRFARYARQRHDRTAHEQLVRHRRRRVQREADAGEK